MSICIQCLGSEGKISLSQWAKRNLLAVLPNSARYLSKMFSNCLKYKFIANVNVVQRCPLSNKHFKKTSQRHLEVSPRQCNLRRRS